MARFDVYLVDGVAGYLVDVQSDLLSELNTRVAIPLMPLSEAPPPGRRLNPVFEIEGEAHALVTQYMAAVPRTLLKSVVADLRDDAAAVTDAIDFVMQGF